MNTSRRSFLFTVCAAALVTSSLTENIGVASFQIFDATEATQATTEAPELTIVLQQIDIMNLQKLASTEVVPSLKGKAFESQVHGVVDTVLNRLASGHWGNSIAAVGNAPWQFSGINSNLKHAYGRLEKMPPKHINKRVAQEVFRYLQLRASGTQSSVGKHLNYLNPIYSSRKSLMEWGNDVVAQATKSGLIFGSGKARHYHGTARGYAKVRVKQFAIVLPMPVS